MQHLFQLADFHSVRFTFARELLLLLLVSIELLSLLLNHLVILSHGCVRGGLLLLLLLLARRGQLAHDRSFERFVETNEFVVEKHLVRLGTLQLRLLKGFRVAVGFGQCFELLLE